MEYLLLIIGLFIGAASVWFFQEYSFTLKKKIFSEENEALKITIQRNEVEKAKRDERINNIESQLNIAAKTLIEKENIVIELKDKLAREETERIGSERRIKEQNEEFEKIKDRLKTDFQNLANRIFEDKSQKFVEQNQNNLNILLAPLNLRIKEFREKIEKTHDLQTRDSIALREQIKNLTELNVQMSKEANNLTNALKGESKTMGNWGELILETILERSGLKKGEEYLLRESFSKEDGKRSQPDVIIALPEEKHLVIDSKVSITAYERYCSGIENDEEKIKNIKNHVLSVRKHINELSQKNYQELYQISAPDFVMMFIPLDYALVIALQNEPELFTEAFDKGIFLVSPSTLLFSLRTIANLWKREKQDRNALEIAKRGGQLYDKFVLFYEQMVKLGDFLNKTHECYNDSLNKLKTGRGSLVSQVEKIKQLGARATKSLPLNIIAEEDELPIENP